MAALYLHNALFIPEAAESSGPPHTRNLSTVSSGTLRTATTEHSHPTEPLLHSSTSESVTYFDLLSRQPHYPNEQPSNWGAGLTLDGDPATLRERRGFWEQYTRRRLKRLKITKVTLEFILGAWAIYNTVRYFLAYTIYESESGQDVSLALGTTSSVSFALLICTVILSIFQPHLLIQHVTLDSILLVRRTTHHLSSLCLLAPALANFAFIFVWRNSLDPELRIGGRCHLDIDIVWSVSDALCKPPAWSVWLVLSIVRLIITLIIIIAYHTASFAYDRTRRPSRSRRSRRRRSRHQPNNSESTYQPSLSPPMSGPSPVIPQLNHQLHNQHETSLSTLGSHTNSKMSSEEFTSDPELYNYPDLATIRGSSGSLSPVGESDRELHGFVDRFRSLVSQITRETEDGLEFSRADHAGGLVGPPQPPPIEIGENFYLPPLPPTIGYDEFGRPYPPEEHVRMLNGYIRRMPTIESMGSREIGSMTSSMYSAGDHERVGSLSRPPTRATALSVSEYTASNPPSRTNSLTAGAEIIAAMGKTSEVGELVDRADREREPAGNRANGSLGSNATHTTGTGASGPSMSRSTLSYYTAHSTGSPGYSPISDDAQPTSLTN